jgi:Enoyl-CoA hydratase/carnithine racemase
VLTGDRYDAAELADYGFINEVVASDTLDNRAGELAERLGQGPPIANESIKRAILAGRDDANAGFEVEAQAFGHLLGTEDMQEGISAFFNDENPNFEGR